MQTFSTTQTSGPFAQNLLSKQKSSAFTPIIAKPVPIKMTPTQLNLLEQSPIS
jgi:hypothetical protein